MSTTTAIEQPPESLATLRVTSGGAVGLRDLVTVAQFYFKKGMAREGFAMLSRILELVEQALNEAIEAEDFERASQLRDAQRYMHGYEVGMRAERHRSRPVSATMAPRRPSCGRAPRPATNARVGGSRRSSSRSAGGGSSGSDDDGESEPPRYRPGRHLHHLRHHDLTSIPLRGRS